MGAGRRCLSCALVAVVLAWANNCAGGELGSAQEQDAALMEYALSLLRADGVLSLRFYDGGTDGLNQFSVSGNAVVLSGVNFMELEKLELRPAGGLPIFRDAPPAMVAHEELPNLGPAVHSIALGNTVQFLAAGSTGSGTDSGGRPYYSVDVPLRVPPATYTQATLHVRRLLLNGTVAGSAFSVIREASLDASSGLMCTTSLRSNQAFVLRLVFDYSLLLSGLPSADQAGVASVVQGSHSGAVFMREHECFTL